MAGDSAGTRSVLGAAVFRGRRPTRSGDLAVETHGIAPIGEDQRYGTPARLFTVWFAPQVNMTGVFTGTLAITLGLGFWLGLLAMVIGTVLGSLVVGYLSTWGPRTGTAQLPISRMAFGGGVVLPAALQWLSSIAWDGLVGLFGADALAVLLGIPFWVAVLIVLAVQGVVGFFGYEVIHRLQAVLTVVLFVTFVVFAVKLVGGHEIVTPAGVQGPDLVGAFVLEVTVALSLAISWASYASDFSRYLPANSSQLKVFGFTFAGIVSAYVFVQGIGLAAAPALSEQTSEGVRSVMGGGVLGALALLVIALAAVGSAAMNDYSGSLALQTVGVRVRRPVSALVVTALAFALILWLHSGDMSSAVPGRAAAGQLLDSRLRRGHGHRLVDPRAGTTHHQSRGGGHRPRGRGGRAGHVRRRIWRRGAVHAHHADRGAGRPRMARRRHRLLRRLPRGGTAVRGIPLAFYVA